MSSVKIILGQKRCVTNKVIFILATILLLIILSVGCSAQSSTPTQASTTFAPVIISQSPTTSGSATIATATTSLSPAIISPEAAKPEGELVAALTDFGNENFLPWKADNGASQLSYQVYDMLIYYDEVNRKFIPGLAESWEVSSDGTTLTYLLRKGIQFSDGWEEFTSADVKYNFERQAGADSVGKVQCKKIASMDTPDPYTLVVHFQTPYPTFFMQISLGEGGVCQGIVSKKYLETVGDDAASQKPIGTGPYTLVDSQLGSYYKFEARENHWRVVPEFKYLTVRNVPEVSTTVAMLKTGELDLALIPAEQMADLKDAGLSTEQNPAGGSIFSVALGGMCISEDNRYDAGYHNKDPWVDPKVRKAMNVAIDRQAICDAIFAGGANPAGAPLFSTDMSEYKYPYDPEGAKQLLRDAGYPNGFSFEAVSYVYPGVPETPRIVEALVGYWMQIGLDPKINTMDYATFSKIRAQMKTAGMVSTQRISQTADVLEKAGTFFMPGSGAATYQDEGAYSIWKEGTAKMNIDEREVYVEKLNKYFYENYIPIPLVQIGACYAWNSQKISPWPHSSSTNPLYLDYVRHVKPFNTFRLFTPWPDR